MQKTTNFICLMFGKRGFGYELFEGWALSSGKIIVWRFLGWGQKIPLSFVNFGSRDLTLGVSFIRYTPPTQEKKTTFNLQFIPAEFFYIIT